MSKTVEQRLQALEDQIAIYQVICGYGYSVDGCNAEAVGSLYSENGVYAVADMEPFEGRQTIADITKSETHLGLVSKGCGHVSTLPYVVIDGDKAVATCHTMVVLKQEKGWGIYRASASRLQLSRKPEGGWQIDHRQNYLLADDRQGSALLSRLREGPKAAAA